MVLRESDFAAVRINWKEKAANIEEIRAELNLGLDALVFVDDSATERAWVRQRLPQVEVPEWPKDPTEYRGALLALEGRFFYRRSLTQEDRVRTEVYRSTAARSELQARSGSLEEFYCSLQMRARIGLASPENRLRISQLTQKTNQFNLSTRRYSEPEIQDLATAPDTRVFWLELDDRFGTNGIVGVAILRATGRDAWAIDTFLLSCRVLGRTVEQALLAFVCGWLRNAGVRWLTGEYRRTTKNSQIEFFLRDAGFSHLGGTGDACIWRADLLATEIVTPRWVDIVSLLEAGHAR
jgi:FkbH-like protein